jgi:hypothetical protein
MTQPYHARATDLAKVARDPPIWAEISLAGLTVGRKPNG